MASALSEDSMPVIVIDPGHGGEDGGATSNRGDLEKDINLAIAQKLQAMLEVSGFSVVMTRESDCSIGNQELATVRERKSSDLHRRLEIVEEQNNCILISIHQNHFSDGKYHGAQIFYSTNDEQSEQLAKSLQEEVVRLLQPENTREIKPSDDSIFLLKNAQVPAVIVECGFLSNDEEAQKLIEPEYQSQMAFSIYSGFLQYWEFQGEQ